MDTLVKYVIASVILFVLYAIVLWLLVRKHVDEFPAKHRRPDNQRRKYNEKIESTQDIMIIPRSAVNE